MNASLETADLLPRGLSSEHPKGTEDIMKRSILAIFGLILVAVLVGPGAAQGKGPITVGSKLDAEGRLLGSMIRLTLEHAGFNVNDKTGTGTTTVTRKALLEGQIDIYPEYTGTAINNFFKGQEIAAGISKDAARSFETVKSLDKKLNNIEWLGRAPANNTWAICTTRALSLKEGIRTLEDFARYVNKGGAVKIIGSQEFIERDDALKSFQKVYGFTLKPEETIVLAGATTAQTESAVAQGTNGVNFAMAYGTDGSIAALGLVVLSDPKGAQPIYQPAPTVRGAVLRQYPELPRLLDPIFATLNEETLQGLNVQIDLQGKNPADVARIYLKTKGLLK
jgi:osmoprotectant transport system substrate-binding protein